MVLTSSGFSPAAVELIQAQLNEVGFEAKIETIPGTQHTQLVYIEHSKALTFDGFAGRESPVQAFQVLFGAQGLMNPNRWSNPELEAQLKKVKQTPTDARRVPRAPPGGDQDRGDVVPEHLPLPDAVDHRPQGRFEGEREAEPAPLRGSDRLVSLAAPAPAGRRRVAPRRAAGGPP